MSIVLSPEALADWAEGATTADLCHALLTQQKETWEQCRRGYENLRDVQLRRFARPGYSISLQFNPGRIKSTAAKVDEQSIRERRCFLCAENLPADQRAVAYEDFLILCNPFPIFREHFTIASRRHIPQRIAGSIGSFLNLARELGPRYLILYNGPKCGASAPDHLHFQAGERGFLPLDVEYHDVVKRYGTRVIATDSLAVNSLQGFRRNTISIESTDADVLIRSLTFLIGLLPGFVPTDDEPMLNILAWFENEKWIVVMLPRRKHRPDAFFVEGEDRILLSPASVDLGGVCITPREQDFQRLTASRLEDLFVEVCITDDQLRTLSQQFSSSAGTMIR